MGKQSNQLERLLIKRFGIRFRTARVICNMARVNLGVSKESPVTLALEEECARLVLQTGAASDGGGEPMDISSSGHEEEGDDDDGMLSACSDHSVDSFPDFEQEQSPQHADIQRDPLIDNDDEEPLHNSVQSMPSLSTAYTNRSSVCSSSLRSSVRSSVSSMSQNFGSSYLRSSSSMRNFLSSLADENAARRKGLLQEEDDEDVSEHDVAASQQQQLRQPSFTLTVDNAKRPASRVVDFSPLESSDASLALSLSFASLDAVDNNKARLPQRNMSWKQTEDANRDWLDAPLQIPQRGSSWENVMNQQARQVSAESLDLADFSDDEEEEGYDHFDGSSATFQSSSSFRNFNGVMRPGDGKPDGVPAAVAEHHPMMAAERTSAAQQCPQLPRRRISVENLTEHAAACDEQQQTVTPPKFPKRQLSVERLPNRSIEELTSTSLPELKL